MFGLVELVTLLLGLAGFSLTSNPSPATPDQALRYAIPDADLVVHVDITSIVPSNYKTLLALPKHPHVSSSPDLANIVREVVSKLEGGRNVTQATTGIDLANDLTDATAFLRLVPNKDPQFVVTVRGKQLTPALVDKIATLSNTPAIAIGGGKMVEPKPGEPAIGVTKDGVILAGTPRLVKDRLAPSWKPPARGPNTNLGHASTAIAAKPVVSCVVTLSPTARRELVAKIGPKNFLADVIRRHRVYSASLYHDGLGWTWLDTTRKGLDQIAIISEGVVDLLRAAHIAPRAVAKILFGALDSYRGSNRQLDELIRRKGDFMKIVEAYTGDGNFKVTANKDPAKLRLDVRAIGKTTSEVVPAGLIGPAAALLLLVSTRASPPPAAPAHVAPPPPPALPAKPPARPAPRPAKRR